ncbi:MAG TPA: BON domain-containing protein [Stellaceae bacterium]|nr:BON domain-containing protein [Stellaceae bacterium]
MRQSSLLRLMAFASIAGAAAAPLQGCLVAAAGAGAGGGYALSQERGIGDTVKDAGIHAAISQSWKDYNIKMADNLDNIVYEGRVLLTGSVPNEEWHGEAVKRTWKVDGVKEVYDEIQVGPPESFSENLSDGEISTKLKAELVADADVKSINYTVTTVRGVVYLIGSARSQAELDRVIARARNTADVRRVVSYVRIRTGEPPATAAASGAPPPSAPPAPGPAAASSPPPAPAASEPVSSPAPRQSIDVVPLK